MEAVEKMLKFQELCIKFEDILNELTSQNFETSVEQVKNLNINTEEELHGVVDLIFEKAINEPNFSELFANMCRHLVSIKVPLDFQPGQIHFRALLLTKCQKEFEQEQSDQRKRNERMKAIQLVDNVKKKELLMEMEEEGKRIHKRQLGNIQFIGEIFKLNMLIEAIIHECIRKLLSQGDEQSLECLCRLLKTIGKELDRRKGIKGPREGYPVDQFFVLMQRIVDRRLTSPRIRFMLQDVIDLKKENWVSRWDENCPETIDQIYKEAERETMEAQEVFQNMLYSRRMPEDTNGTLGYNQPHQLSSYATSNMIQIPPHNTATVQQRKKHIPIIDPKTGKNILENEIPVQKNEKFDFTADLNQAVQKSELTVEEIKSKLRELLLSKENKEIFDWIDTHISASIPGNVKFLRALTYEVHKSALINKTAFKGGEKYELDRATLKTRIPLLNRYINHNENSELQSLYEIQQLMNELRHPKGVLRQIFDILYDDDVISEEAFKEWEQSKDPDELEGKGFAMLSVRGFFTWLRDAESGEDCIL